MRCLWAQGGSFEIVVCTQLVVSSEETGVAVARGIGSSSDREMAQFGVNNRSFSVPFYNSIFGKECI